MIILLWIWIVTAAVALVTAGLAVVRMRGWWQSKTMRSLVLFFIGVSVYAAISLYLSGTALGGPRAQLDRRLGDPALLGIELLTVGQLFMLIPAILLAVQMLGIFDTSPKEGTPV